MTIAQFSEKVKQFTLTVDELGYKVRFVFPEGVVFLDGTVTPSKVNHDETTPAHTTLKMSLGDAFKFMEGNLNPTLAFMTGQIKIDGKIGVALKIVEMVNRKGK